MNCLCLNVTVSFSVVNDSPVPLLNVDLKGHHLPIFLFMLTPLSVGSSKVHPCGDQWHNFITSVAVFGV